VPKEFREEFTEAKEQRYQELHSKEGKSAEEHAEFRTLDYARHNTVLKPDCCIGWVAGHVLGDDGVKAVLFVKDGDAWVFLWPGFRPPSWCKQIYV
jgi:hypothetical protein